MLVELIEQIIEGLGGKCTINSPDANTWVVRTTCRNADHWSALFFIVEDDIVYSSSYMEHTQICVSDPKTDLEKWVTDLREGKMPPTVLQTK